MEPHRDAPPSPGPQLSLISHAITRFSDFGLAHTSPGDSASGSEDGPLAVGEGVDRHSEGGASLEGDAMDVDDEEETSAGAYKGKGKAKAGADDKSSAAEKGQLQYRCGKCGGLKVATAKPCQQPCDEAPASAVTSEVEKAAPKKAKPPKAKPPKAKPPKAKPPKAKPEKVGWGGGQGEGGGRMRRRRSGREDGRDVSGLASSQRSVNAQLTPLSPRPSPRRSECTH